MPDIVKIEDSLNEGRVKINEEFKKIKNNVVDFIESGSITPEKTSFVRPGKNLFNKNKLTNGRVTVTGNIVVDEDNKTTDYEFIEGSTTYFTNKSVFTAQYDKNGEFISYLFVPQNTTITTESNAYFIRISTGNANTETLQFEKGSTGTAYENYYRTLSNVEFKELIEARGSSIKGVVYGDVKQRLDNMEQDISSLEPPGTDTVSDEIAEQVFINEMNRKAQLLGCENLNFKNSSGLSAPGQTTSPKDLALITRHASGMPNLLKVWGIKSYEVDVKGSDSRKVNIQTTVTDADFEQDYLILGGKTGTLGVVKNLCLVAKHRNSGHVLAGSILRADNDRWIAMKQLFDEVINIIENKGSASSTVESVGACALLLPENPLLYSGTELNELYLHGNTLLQSPASITKVLTSIVLLENISNLNETLTYKNSDKVEDSLVFNEGDKITFKDALYLMMLQSSNTTAKAVARAVGQRIVRTRGYAL